MGTLGDHHAAYSTVGVIRGRAVPLERKPARVRREAGGQVRTNRLLTNLNLESDLRAVRRTAKAQRTDRRDGVRR